jgi:hypothetical protein
VRGELSGKRRRDACGAVALTRDRGDDDAPIEFVEGGGLWCSERPKGVGRRRGSSQARWSEARRSCVEENQMGGGGSGGLSSGGRRAARHVEKKNWWPGQRREV